MTTQIADVAAIIVSWRTPDLAAGLVNHLANHWPELDVVLVECGPESHDLKSAHLTVLRGGNLGYAGGNDLGIHAALAAGKRYVLVLNSDAAPLPGSIEELIAVLDADSGVAACGATLVRWSLEGVEVNAGTRFDWARGETQPDPAEPPASVVGFPCGAVVLLRAEALRMVGGFDANMFLYYEDLDWVERANSSGASVWVSRRAIALHQGSVSTQRSTKAGVYFRARNRLWVIRRHGLRHGQGLSPVRETIRAVKMTGRPLAAGHLGLILPYAVGMVHGLTQLPEPSDDPSLAQVHQRWETRDVVAKRRQRLSRVATWASQPEVASAPIRAIRRRCRYEFDRRLRPRSLACDRLTELDESLRIWVRPADDIERSILLLGSYDHAAAKAFARLAPVGGVVADIGAHVGQFTLLGARAVGPTGRVLSFEPQPKMFARLQRNVAENGFQNVSAHPVALGGSTSVVHFHRTESDTNSGLASVCVEGDRCNRSHHDVELRRLDDITNEEDIVDVDVMKIDVEGFELDVFIGASEVIDRSHPAILLEANEVTADASPPQSPALDHLVRLGYHLFGIGPADGESPHLHPVATGQQVHALRRPGRPINVVALHENWNGYDRARRWIVAHDSERSGK